jgi:hypothetical protein
MAVSLGLCYVKCHLFRENQDSIDSYIRRFQRHANSMEWPFEKWSLYLGNLLTGKALEIYSRFSAEQASDFEQLKTALLTWYQLNAEGFKRKFEGAKLDATETVDQYISRLDGYWTR